MKNIRRSALPLALLALATAFPWPASACTEPFGTRSSAAADAPPSGPEISLSSVDLAAEGDFIHSLWQRSNSYRSRYKPMKSGGAPVRDLEAYVRERGIPREVRAYYRRTTAGTYEEDIKQIPNRWLAPNNAAENSAGAESYLRHLARIARDRPASAKEAVERARDALRAVHAEWHARNASWTVPGGVPAAFDDAPIEARYNGAAQLRGLAERHGLDRDPLWREALDRLMSELAREKFAPYAAMSAEDAFLAMIRSAGTRPSLEGEPEARRFLEAKLPDFGGELLPDGRADEAAAVARLLRERFADALGTRSIELRSPPVPPGSTARIHLVFSGSRLLAALKLQRGAAGLDEIVSTAATARLLEERADGFRAVRTLAYGRLGGGDFFILQEAARVHEADRAFDLDPAARAEAADLAAATLARIHGRATRTRGLDREALAALGADLTTFRGNCFYDVRKMEAFLPGGAQDALTPAVAAGEVPERDAAELAARIRAATDAYAARVELRPETLEPAEVHGDFHGGNLFVDFDRHRSMVIDYSGLAWFIGRRIGTGDRGNDLGRLAGNLLVEAARHRLDFEQETLPLLRRFLRRYLEEAGIEPGSEGGRAARESTRFYLNRLLALNVADREGRKLRPLPGDSPSSLRARLLQQWLQLLRTEALID